MLVIVLDSVRRAAGLRSQVADAVLAGVLLVIGQTEVWMRWQAGGIGVASRVSHPSEALMVVFFTAPLALRRWTPLRACFVVCAALGIQVLFVAPKVSLLAGLLPLLIAEYSAAAYGPARWRTFGLLAAFAVEAAFVARIPEERSAGELLFGLFLIAGVWVVGDLARSRQLRVDQARSHALRVEAERDAWTLDALAEERTQIARELHDVIAHGVSLMGVQAAAARALVDTGADLDAVRDALRSIESSSRESVGELQRLLGVLRDGEAAPALEPQPGLARLRDLVAEMRAAGVPVQLDVTGDERPLPAGVDLAAYRVVQEALTNTLKHAGGAVARVQVRYRANELALDVVDDGSSANGVVGRGHGLLGMHERVALYGGSLEVGHVATGGFCVSARIPLAAEAT
ncbi:MAG: sensor histidine kinase [Acidothermaceae bacterium]